MRAYKGTACRVTFVRVRVKVRVGLVLEFEGYCTKGKSLPINSHMFCV